MKVSHALAFFAILIGAPYSFASIKQLESPRTDFALSSPQEIGIKDTSNRIDVVRIWPNKAKSKDDQITVLIDTKGVQTVSSSANFPLKVTVTRPSVDFPFTLIVFEKKKDKWMTDLVEAVAVKSGVARFLSENEYKILTGTHESIPKVVDELNKELNDLLKNE